MSDARIRLCLVLHNHQPVGNFEDVIQKAFEDSYLPFLDLFEQYTSLRIGLHTSGPLLLWLDKHQPEYLNRVRTLVSEGRIEIIGGAFHEPILTMIPSADRQGQIRRFSEWLNHRFDTKVRGMWIPERVWEANLVSDIAAAGIEYTVLDDFHFRCAGLAHDGLHGDYVTEDQGSVLRVFPGSEQLRYTIPFQAPHETINYLREIAEARSGATVVFADDGEKFGTWPETNKHVYENGWLRSFFDALIENRDWLDCTTLSQAADESHSKGKIYLPAASYREMTEWALPVERQQEFESISHELDADWRWPRIRKFMRGGFWRNFKKKYPETDEMYSRMMHVSKRWHAASTHGDAQLLDDALDHLYRGQCNCAYWHGAFGGVYLPHLRNAVFHHLILADNLIDQALSTSPIATIEAADFNFDRITEVRMANANLIGWFRPTIGGHLYELDVRSIGHNLLATMDRRPEAYHEKVRRGAGTDHDDAASIHDQVKFKQEGLEKLLIYDQTPCKSLVDHFWQMDTTHEEWVQGTATPISDFATGSYESTLRRSAERNQILMNRTAQVLDDSVKLTKGVTLQADGSTLEIAYLLENLSQDRDTRFGVEFNFAGMPAGFEDRFYTDKKGEQIGDLSTALSLNNCDQIALSDGWLGLQVDLSWNKLGALWTTPVTTVSGSEGGFESVHQSVKVQPIWMVRGDQNGRWVVKLELKLNTRAQQEAEKAADSTSETAQVE